MMQAYTEEQRKALIGRLNQIAEKLKWHNAAYAQDVLLAVDALNATSPQPVLAGSSCLLSLSLHSGQQVRRHLTQQA
ncbi:hypothetical protein [Pantoea sp. ACRSB]|uniref:hypothetical protein n=1 Tax=Pantoea sp. ACRSB TaxID=2918207 RepID=UPI002892B3C4|nr:hypothetical protein [Pantoea sp. ACRSB]MCG7388730.1 hypothetical protein [Pantoea sp. ACRSB]